MHFRSFSTAFRRLYSAEKRLKLPEVAPWLALGVLVVCCWWSERSDRAIMRSWLPRNDSTILRFLRGGARRRRRRSAALGGSALGVL